MSTLHYLKKIETLRLGSSLFHHRFANCLPLHIDILKKGWQPISLPLPTLFIVSVPTAVVMAPYARLNAIYL
jgi:hypothetical protein